ncbi:MAG TPA: transcription antitermination factor NusB, partial [Acidimicrobiales bacterium]|nr:transcription antitermination factor NusB [Acidimicrobiales bacterium]
MSRTVAPERTAREVAVDALVRIEHGAYANLVLPSLLARSRLPARDRAFATDLVYGTTRMRRACDWLLEPHVRRRLDDDVRSTLRLGTYQLAVAGTSPHAAVAATVDAAPPRDRGLVNAVLRKVASALPPAWPDEATELSYP